MGTFDMVFPFAASFVQRSIGLEADFDLTPMNLQYIDILNKVVVYHREEQWVKSELSWLRSEIEEFKRVL